MRIPKTDLCRALKIDLATIDLENLLISVGAVKENDYRVSRSNEYSTTDNKGSMTAESDDDDWD